MTDTRTRRLIDPELIGGTEQEPRLIGSACQSCGTVTFPRQASCPRCTSEDVHARELATRGTLWTWTIQCFAPKSPPYPEAGVEEFEPYGVGYIELPGEVRVEARLTESHPRSAADRHADGADADPRPRSTRPADVRLPAGRGGRVSSLRGRRGRRRRHPPVRSSRRGVRASDGRHRRPPCTRRRGDRMAGRRLRRRRVRRRRQRRHLGVNARVDRGAVHQRQERVRHRRIGADDGSRHARLRSGRGRARRRLRQAPARGVQPSAGGVGHRLLVRRDGADAHDPVLRHEDPALHDRASGSRRRRWPRSR